MNEEKCYMCDRNATSSEHVPPKCLFPEIKDTKGINFRKDLITVPSCDIHNSKKSNDDEFLMLSLSGLIKNNPVGNFHQLTKANRALKRKNKSFIQKHILKNQKYGGIKTTDGKYRIVSYGNPDIQRLQDCFEHIAYGLYYHEFKTRFEGKIRIFLGFVEYYEKNMQTFKDFIKKRFDLETVLNTENKGANPHVFYYQFHKPDEFGIIGLKMVFYGTAEVYLAYMGKESKEPNDLTMMLMNKGIKTTLKLDDEEFVFND